ncbi:hypothetical protein M2437_003230 [Methylorubrum pseudosasae]|nr:hypothetical protein [Methylorubrum pseudosasae]
MSGTSRRGSKPDRLCAQIAQAYRHAPHRRETMSLVEDVLDYASADLFDHLRHGLLRTCAHLSVATPIRTASMIEGVTDLRRQDRVINLCERLGAATYVNPIGGTTLYDPAAFAKRGIGLRFLRARPLEYAQGPHPFVPWLSILDVLMFNPRSALAALLVGGYDLIEGEDAPCPAGTSSAASSIPRASTAAPG